jgi:hypothetical protein
MLASILVMALSRLCQQCKNLHLKDLIKELDGTTPNYSANFIDVYRLSHDEFYQCASSCDICAVTASCFQKDTDIFGEHSGDPVVIVSVRKENGQYRLIFTDKSNWNPISWMIYESDGEQLISLCQSTRLCSYRVIAQPSEQTASLTQILSQRSP